MTQLITEDWIRVFHRHRQLGRRLGSPRLGWPRASMRKPLDAPQGDNKSAAGKDSDRCAAAEIPSSTRGLVVIAAARRKTRVDRRPLAETQNDAVKARVPISAHWQRLGPLRPSSLATLVPPVPIASPPWQRLGSSPTGKEGIALTRHHLRRLSRPSRLSRLSLLSR